MMLEGLGLSVTRVIRGFLMIFVTACMVVIHPGTRKRIAFMAKKIIRYKEGDGSILKKKNHFWAHVRTLTQTLYSTLSIWTAIALILRLSVMLKYIQPH